MFFYFLNINWYIKNFITICLPLERQKPRLYTQLIYLSCSADLVEDRNTYIIESARVMLRSSRIQSKHMRLPTCWNMLKHSGLTFGTCDIEWKRWHDISGLAKWSNVSQSLLLPAMMTIAWESSYMRYHVKSWHFCTA